MPKNIVICYDGTGNEYRKHNTNVVKLFQAIARDQEQVAFYDPGVGTFSFLGRTVGRHVGTLMGKLFGYGLEQNLEDGYEYLMNHFEENDRLFLFGFSRGAFQARALGGMLKRFGLLQRGSKNLVPYVSRMYNRMRTYRGRKGVSIDVAAGFKETFSHPCTPYFIGVWDTVESLGWFYGRRFFDATLSEEVEFGYHAVSIDEKRKKFPVLLWDERDKDPNQTIEQVWFSGVHSDVGGSYPEHQLSDIALEWMLERAETQGLRLRPGWQDWVRPKPEPDGAGFMHESRIHFWRLWRPAPRTIPSGALIHSSVQERMDKERTYQPNLPPNHGFIS